LIGDNHGWGIPTSDTSLLNREILEFLTRRVGQVTRILNSEPGDFVPGGLYATLTPQINIFLWNWDVHDFIANYESSCFSSKREFWQRRHVLKICEQNSTLHYYFRSYAKLGYRLIVHSRRLRGFYAFNLTKLLIILSLRTTLLTKFLCRY